jgi:hypothetical protein
MEKGKNDLLLKVTYIYIYIFINYTFINYYFYIAKMEQEKKDLLLKIKADEDAAYLKSLEIKSQVFKSVFVYVYLVYMYI